MTNEQVQQILESNPMCMYPKHTAWIQAFKEYNEAHSPVRLGMGCRPCYAKVYLWIKGKHAKNS